MPPSSWQHAWPERDTILFIHTLLTGQEVPGMLHDVLLEARSTLDGVNAK